MQGFPRVLILGLVLPVFHLSAAPPSAEFDLNGMPTSTGTLMRVHGFGMSNDGVRGVPVCGGFDCDGDGFKDVAMAQIQHDPLGRGGAGSVSLLFGDGAIGGTYDADTFSGRLLKIAGDKNLEVTGAEIWMDDVTGDGLGDLLIGRQNYTPTAGREGAGALTIIFGGASLRSNAVSLAYYDLRTPPAGARQLTIVGVAAYDRLGIWMRTGDVDGDGQVDLVVGADEADQAGEAVTYNSGSAYVIRGGGHLTNGPAVLDLASFGSTALEGHVACILPPLGASDFHMGGTVATGDLDGNDRSEVLLAATMRRGGAALRLPGSPPNTGEHTGGTAEGTLYIAWDESFPPYLWPSGYTFRVDAPVWGDTTRIDGYRDDGVQRDLHFGEEIQAGMDFSGDGFPDLFLGDINGVTSNGISSGLGFVIYNASSLRGMSFHMTDVPSNVAHSTFIGPSEGALGGDTAAQGDFDGDGIADLAVGSPHNPVNSRTNAGSVHIFYGQPSGWPEWIDLKDGSLPEPAEARILLISGALGNDGIDTGDVLCYSAAVEDIDGDGMDDFIVNEMEGDALGGSPADVGNLLVIPGAALMASPDPGLSLFPSGKVDFGAQDIGLGATASIGLVISNHNPGPVTVLDLSVRGPAASSFSIDSDSGESNLVAGAVRSLQASYNPDDIGNHGAALAIVTDSDIHQLGLALCGTGIDTNSTVTIEALSFIADDACLRFNSQRGYDYRLLRGTNPANLVEHQTGLKGTGGSVPAVDVDAASLLTGFYSIEGASHPTP